MALSGLRRGPGRLRDDRGLIVRSADLPRVQAGAFQQLQHAVLANQVQGADDDEVVPAVAGEIEGKTPADSGAAVPPTHAGAPDDTPGDAAAAGAESPAEPAPAPPPDGDTGGDDAVTDADRPKAAAEPGP